MKLKKLKKLLADKIESYTVVVKEEDEQGNVYEVEYTIDCSTIEPEKKFLYELFKDPIYEGLKNFKVDTVFSGKNGFLVYLKAGRKLSKLKEIAKQNKIQIKSTEPELIESTKYIVI